MHLGKEERYLEMCPFSHVIVCVSVAMTTRRFIKLIPFFKFMIQLIFHLILVLIDIIENVVILNSFYTKIFK